MRIRRPSFSRSLHTTPSAVTLCLLGLMLVGCGSPAEESAAPETAPSPEPDPRGVALDRAVLDDPSRPQEERAEDEGRRPIDVYEFFEIQPGQTVADVYSSAGYNTHLLSRIVGDSGRVFSVFEFYSEEELFDGELYTVPEVTERVESSGLGNVELAMRLSDVPSDAVDVAIAIRNYHDVEWVFQGLTRADQLAEFYRVVKPGGLVGIVEVATDAEGWDEAAHRLNKQVVIDDFTGVGFELAGESDILANAEDDRSVAGFPNRFTTDRYVLKFQKPAR